MRRLLILLLALLGTVLAADHPDIVLQGFSPDARYHLLLTDYVQDGSGFPVAALQITDVRRDVVVYRTVKTWNTDMGATAPGDPAAVLRASQATLLARYGLTHPVAGQRLFKVTAPPEARLSRARDGFPGHGGGPAEPVAVPTFLGVHFQRFSHPRLRVEARRAYLTARRPPARLTQVRQRLQPGDRLALQDGAGRDGSLVHPGLRGAGRDAAGGDHPAEVIRIPTEPPSTPSID